MPRLISSDERCSKLKRIMLDEVNHAKLKLRLSIEGMFYRMRVGCPWRDPLLEKCPGKWSKISQRIVGLVVLSERYLQMSCLVYA